MYCLYPGLAQDRDRWQMLVIAVMNLRVPWNAGNFSTSCKLVSFSRSTLHHGVSTYVFPTVNVLWISLNLILNGKVTIYEIHTVKKLDCLWALLVQVCGQKTQCNWLHYVWTIEDKSQCHRSLPLAQVSLWKGETTPMTVNVHPPNINFNKIQ